MIAGVKQGVVAILSLKFKAFEKSKEINLEKKYLPGWLTIVLNYSLQIGK